MGRDKFRDRVALGLLHLAVAILGYAWLPAWFSLWSDLT